MNDIFVYVNVKGRIIEAVPIEVEEATINSYYIPDTLIAKFLTRINAEEKRGNFYERYLSISEGKIKNNSLWLRKQDKDKARNIFYKDLMERYKKAERKFNLVLDEKERFESVEPWEIRVSIFSHKIHSS